MDARATCVAGAVGIVLALGLWSLPATAGTTGTITGIVTNEKGTPLAGVAVSAVSGSQTATAHTDARGFYSFVALGADTYTISFHLQGYVDTSVPGVTVFQDENFTLNQRLQASLKTIATVQASGGSNLVKPNEGSDVYNVSGQQLTAVTNPGDLHETLYQYAATVPGVTTTGFPGQPRVRGGQVTDLGYEFEGIPIQDRMVGFFSTNLSNIGVSNLEVYTGGLSAQNAANGTGFLNSVVKVGTNPGFVNLFGDMTSPAFNHYLTFEAGYATPDRRFSYYVGFDGVNSQNAYDYGTYPGVLFWGYDGTGPVVTRDLVGNFHYRPSNKDDIQFLITNSYGEFDYNYLISPSPGQPPALAFEPCPGSVPSATTFSHAIGGTAPNGQSCPEGMYWSQLSPGSGNTWYHYGGIGKIQWNHNIDSHSFFSLRVAENYNSYIFDQTIGDANIPWLENPGAAYNWATVDGAKNPNVCPTYPYAAGSPVQGFNLKGSSGPVNQLCAFDNGIQDFWGERRANMYFGFLDYQNIINDHVTVKAGVNDEVDNNVFNYVLTNQFNYSSTNQFGNNGTWPAEYENATYPTNTQQAYAEGDFKVGKFLLVPGLLYAQQHYGYPNGGQTVSIINPTFNGTFTLDPHNVFRFSYGDTSSFIGSAYVYTTPSSLISRNPKSAGATFSPQLNHSADFMYEHQFDAETSMRVGPWYNKTTNYFEEYTPIVGHTASGGPIYAKQSILANNQAHNDLGIEFALNRVDPHKNGFSFWITSTYDNYWTTSTALASSFVNTPLPQDLINEGVLVRAAANPLWNNSVLFDVHRDRFHFDPFIVYQTVFFYNIGVLGTTANGSSYIAQPELRSGAYWIANLSAYEELGTKRNVIVGIKVDNLFNNTNDVSPCPSDGTGCFPFNGAYSGVVNQPGYIYQNYSQNQRLFEFFAGVRL